MRILTLFPVLFLSFCSAQNGVQPVPIDQPAPTTGEPSQSIAEQLNRIESKIDQNLTITKSVKNDTLSLSESQVELIKSIGGLKESNNLNAAAIVAAIKSNGNPGNKQPVAKSNPGRTVIRSTYRSISAPRWNLDGSWTRVRNKSDLLSHLATSHNYSREWLQSMTIGQLWALHDDTHTTGRQSLDVIPVDEFPIAQPPSSDCPGGVCPAVTRSRSITRGVLFPRAWWNR